MMVRRLSWVAALGALAVLAACTTEHDDLRQWMNQERNQAVPKVTPVSEPKVFVPLAYTEAASADPFGVERLAQALRRDSSTGASSGVTLIDSELNRRKEALEVYPLDVMTMVGSIARKGEPVALVRVDKLLYQVRVGNYLGQNYGKVIGISESGVSLRELVQDGVGEWIERSTELQLQEKKQ